MTPEAKAHYAELQKNKRRIFPVKNVSDKHPNWSAKQPANGVVVCSILPGKCGLVSAVDLLQERTFLKPITVEDWDNEGFDENDPIKKRKSNNKGGEAQSDAD